MYAVGNQTPAAGMREEHIMNSATYPINWHMYNKKPPAPHINLPQISNDLFLKG